MTTPSPILTTKLYTPRPHPETVARARLFERLMAGWRAGHRLTLIAAPAGFGKTTLAATWLRTPELWGEEAALPGVAWFSLDHADGDHRRFLTYLVAALETVRPGVEAAVKPLLGTPQPAPSSAVLTALINALATSPAPLILVLDDYHVIEGDAVHSAVTFLLDHLPPQMHLVIASRADPPLPLARLRTRRQLTEIRAVDLRFTLAEALALFNEVMGLSLPAAAVEALEARTEGWIAGLHLAAHSLRTFTGDAAAGEVAGFIADFSGSHRHVIDYLVEEVLAHQPEAVRDFLLRTSILMPLSAQLCAAVTGREDAGELLWRLEEDNLFLVPLDDARIWYRYHHLFADFLCTQARARFGDDLRDLHLRAARAYETLDMPAQALDHLLAAGAMEQAAHLLEVEGHALLMHNEAAALLRWMDALDPSLILERPALCVLKAEALLIVGKIDDIDVWSTQAEAGLARDASPEADALRGQIQAVRAYQALLAGDLHKGIGGLQQALAQMEGATPFMRSVVMWLTGFFQYFDRSGEDSLAAVDESLRLSQASGNVLMMGLSLFISSYIKFLQGHLREMRALLERSVQALGVQSPAWREQPLAGASLIYQGLGQVLREMNELDAAARHTAHSVELAHRWGNAEVLVDGVLLLARVRLAQGRFDAVREALAELAALLRSESLSILSVRQIEAYRARAFLDLGEPDAAGQWAEAWFDQYADHPVEGPQRIQLFIHWIEISVVVHWMLAQREPGAALRYLTPLLSSVVEEGWMGIAIEILALQAVAFYLQGDMPAALSALRRALDQGAPEGYVRAFIDLGEPMATLLRRAQVEGCHPAYTEALLAAMERDKAAGFFAAPHLAGGAATAPASEIAPPVEPLSDREREVLALIAEGLANREIADRLYIAVSTVKSHINNLYGKLGVTNRAQAVTRAHDLRLL